MMADTLLIRADASSAIGVGHVMRCLALAQAWQDAGGRVVLAARELPDALRDRLQRENVQVHLLRAEAGSSDDATATTELAVDCGAAWVVVDGYRFGVEFLERLGTSGRAVLLLDDMFHLERYTCDLLLNQNLSATAERYRGRVEESATLLLGPRYGLLRREFRETAPTQASTVLAGPRRILVSFGGSDPENFSAAVLARLAQSLGDIEVRVLAGAANRNIAALQAMAVEAPFPCEVLVNVEHVAAAMRWAHVAITAGGSTVWELACLRVPALIGATEDNQLAGLAALRAVPFFAAYRIEELLAGDLTQEIETLLARPERPLGMEFDGRGAIRVVEAMLWHSARLEVMA